MSEFNFELETPISYHHKGETLEDSTLTLKAPSYKQRNSSHKLKQLFYKALKPMLNKSDEDKSGSDTEERIKGPDILNLFLMSEVPMENVMATFEELIISGVCLIGEEKINKHMLDKMSLRDMEKLFGEYMSLFLATFS